MEIETFAVALMMVMCYAGAYHFILSILLGIVKELIFLFVKNKNEKKIYFYCDVFIGMTIPIIPIFVLPIMGITSVIFSGFKSLISYETLFFFVVFIVEIRFFLQAYKEYKEIQMTH